MIVSREFHLRQRSSESSCVNCLINYYLLSFGYQANNKLYSNDLYLHIYIYILYMLAYNVINQFACHPVPTVQ